jgi:transcriptional regulator with XRE-family HTH domain
MKFNENLKFLRKKEGLTQEELAEKLNVSRQSVTKWESGNAIPDIEKIKEIAYIFLISVDSLIGDIENKTPNKLKKRIQDIGWFIFAILVFAVIVNISISEFLIKIIPNINYAIGIIILMIILTFSIMIFLIKKYLMGNKEKIVNMLNNDKGKKERKKFIIKKYTFALLLWLIFCIVTNINFIIESWKIYFLRLLEDLFIGLVIDIILAIVEYKRLEKKVIDLQ